MFTNLIQNPCRLFQAGFSLNMNVIHDKDNAFPKAVRRGLGAVNAISRDPFINVGERFYILQFYANVLWAVFN